MRSIYRKLILWKDTSLNIKVSEKDYQHESEEYT